MVSPDSHKPVVNMDRWYNVERTIHGDIIFSSASFPIRLELTALPVEIEHWHVSYNYPHGDKVEIWLLWRVQFSVTLRKSAAGCSNRGALPNH